MIRHNLNISWRILLKHKAYSLLNIGGLAVGMTVALLISLWIYDELAFIIHLSTTDKIAKVSRFEVIRGQKYAGYANPACMAAELRTVYGEEFEQVVLSSGPQQIVIKHNEQMLTERGQFTDGPAASLLSLSMIHGSHLGLEDQQNIFYFRSDGQKVFWRG